MIYLVSELVVRATAVSECSGYTAWYVRVATYILLCVVHQRGRTNRTTGCSNQRRVVQDKDHGCTVAASTLQYTCTQVYGYRHRSD